MIESLIVRDVASLLAAVGQAFHHVPQRGHWFRGHASADWQLVPAVHRRYAPEDELDLTSRFRLGAPTRYPNCPPNGDFARWLCLMQHFGLPTRLLDWSESPLVAAFFAVGYEPQVGPAAIWCLSPGDLNAAMTGRASLAILAHERVAHLVEPAFLGGDSPNEALAVVGQEVDLRMVVQQGVFTVHGGPDPLEIYPDSGRFLRKFVIPAESVADLRRDLWLLGIRRSMLFPDIENLAHELAVDWRHKGRNQTAQHEASNGHLSSRSGAR